MIVAVVLADVVLGFVLASIVVLGRAVRRHGEDLVAMAGVVDDLRQAPADPGPASTWWERVQRRSVLIHLVDERTIRGVVSAVLPDGVLLVSAEYLEDGGGRIELAGDVFVPADRVAFAQQEPARRRRKG
jgi:hypothetical protein